MKITSTLFFALALTFSIHAQVEISYAPSYADQVFYRLSDDEKASIPLVDWDIAFTTYGLQDGGIHLNEASTLSGVPLALYLAPTNDFSATISADDLTDLLGNDEKSWNYGAFNGTRDESNPLDYGWGIYNPGAMTVVGEQVFVIKLRDESYKKIQITELSSASVYSFKYADLNGSNEESVTISKSDFAGEDLALFSFSSGDVVGTSLPENWDLLFSRYTSTLDDGSGGVIPYNVTGVLSGVGVQVAKALEVNPGAVDFADYEDSLSTELDIIGHDWKSFDLDNFEWLIPSDRAYFIKTADEKIWKLYFLDFEGSGTGVAVFVKTELGTVNTVSPNPIVESMNVFPNPIQDEATVAFSLKKASRVQIQIVDMQGRTVWTSQATDSLAGFNSLTIRNLPLAKGQYALILNADDVVITQQITKL